MNEDTIRATLHVRGHLQKVILQICSYECTKFWYDQKLMNNPFINSNQA